MGWGRYEPEGRRTRTEENGLNWIIHKHQGEGVFAETYPVKDIEGVSTRHLRGPARGGHKNRRTGTQVDWARGSFRSRYNRQRPINRGNEGNAYIIPKNKHGGGSPQREIMWCNQINRNAHDCTVTQGRAHKTPENSTDSIQWAGCCLPQTVIVDPPPIRTKNFPTNHKRSGD